METSQTGNPYARSIVILVLAFLVSVVSYSAVFIFPPVAVDQPSSQLSARHRELLDKSVLSMEEAAELSDLVSKKTTELMSRNNGNLVLRQNALIVSWLPWLLFAAFFPRLVYRELLFWLPAIFTFSIAGLFVPIEIAVYMIVGGITIAGKQYLSRDTVKSIESD